MITMNLLPRFFLLQDKSDCEVKSHPFAKSSRAGCGSELLRNFVNICQMQIIFRLVLKKLFYSNKCFEITFIVIASSLSMDGELCAPVFFSIVASMFP